MTSAHRPANPPKTTRSLRRFWPVLPLAAILIALLLEDLHVMGWSPFEKAECGIAELDQSSFSAKLYNPLAEWGVHHTGLPRVAIVYIDSTTEPAELVTNTCASRVFLARLVPDLIKLGANVIVFDKFYTENACADMATNHLFQSSLEASTVPVVIGQPTHPLASDQLEGCLGLSRGFAFDPTKKVVHGLTRLNADALKIPVRWPVFDDLDHPGATPVKLPEEAGDTLALVAAKALEPTLETTAPMAKLLASGDHPYTTFLDLPNIHAMNVICSAEEAPLYADGTPIPCGPWKRDPANLDGKSLTLAGKAVVIGDISDADLQNFPGGQRPGVYLQANYIESLLDQRFLTETPLPVTIVFLVLFVIGAYTLYWAHDAAGHPILTPERAGLWSLALLGVLVLLSISALLAFNLFTPVWALWGAVFFAVFRYLEASGHRRSEHLLSHLAGDRPEATHPQEKP